MFFCTVPSDVRINRGQVSLSTWRKLPRFAVSEQYNRRCSVGSEDSNCRTKENKLAGHIWAWQQFLHQANLEDWLLETRGGIDPWAPGLSQVPKHCTWEASAFWRKKKGELGGCMVPSVPFALILWSSDATISDAVNLRKVLSLDGVPGALYHWSPGPKITDSFISKKVQAPFMLLPTVKK